MKKLACSSLTLALFLGIVSPIHARNTKHLLPISVALAVKDAQEKLDGSVKFYFGNQETPKILTKLGSDVSNRN